MPIIILAFCAISMTVNRMAHRVDFIHKHQAWVLKTYPGSKPLSSQDLWANCLDGSAACEITPELEKAQRQEYLSAQENGGGHVLR